MMYRVVEEKHGEGEEEYEEEVSCYSLERKGLHCEKGIIKKTACKNCSVKDAVGSRRLKYLK